MLEKFKSLLLLVLIGSSLFFTYQLWYGHKPTELAAEDIYEQVDVEKPRLIEDAITPFKIVINQGDDYILLRKEGSLFNRFWMLLSNLLKTVDNSFIPGQPEELTDEYQLCVKCYFEPLLPVGDEMPWLKGVPGEGIEYLKIYCYEDNVWLIVNRPGGVGEKHLSLNQDDFRQVKNFLNYIIVDHDQAYHLLTTDLVSERFGWEIDVNPSIYVPRDQRFMSSVSLEQEILDEELLLKTFFVDYTLARVIEERDGGLLYTDGEKGLRLSDYSFEYSYPRLEEGSTDVSYYEALRNSINIVSYHGGWPAYLRLASIELQSRRGNLFYSAEWNIFHNGYPVLTAQSIKASFNDLGLFHFSRMLLKPKDESAFSNEELAPVEKTGRVNITDWSEAVKKAIDQFDDYVIISGARIRLEKVELGYAALNTEGLPKAVPVWIISINGENIILKADDLETIHKEDLF